jgi:hypothetical protein
LSCTPASPLAREIQSGDTARVDLTVLRSRLVFYGRPLSKGGFKKLFISMSCPVVAIRWPLALRKTQVASLQRPAFTPKLTLAQKRGKFRHFPQLTLPHHSWSQLNGRGVFRISFEQKPPAIVSNDKTGCLVMRRNPGDVVGGIQMRTRLSVSVLIACKTL